MDLRRMTLASLMAGGGLVAVTLVALIMWVLLAGLGDERGAAAAQMVSIIGGVGVLFAQILLVALLALGSLGWMMEDEVQA